MDLAPLLQEPELRPYLALLYLAWADGELGPDERALIRARLEAQPWLKPRLREALEGWLSGPPPPARALEQLRRAIAGAVKNLSPRALASFASLAEEVASVDAAARATLDDLQQSLGLRPFALALRAAEPPPSRYAAPPTFAPQKVQALLDGRFASARDAVRHFLSDPQHRAMYGVDKERARSHIYGWLKELAAAGFGKPAYPGITSGAEDGLGPFLATFEMLGLGDLSLVVKYGVQFGLWGGSIYFLGTEAQKAELLPRVASLELPGCFAMSEVGHGSNVADLETTATWHAGKRRFVLHTPGESARKDWAGNAALHATHATVFAQLEVGAEHHGVHAFVVRIRSDDGQPMPGVRIGDCGHKLGLNGVDNGRLWFDHVELSRDALLGRYAEVTEAGEYRSPIESPSKRFFTMLGTLVGGRLAVAAAGLSA
ncbi:MAG: acyl-CoA dehydrogenase family protein, partial [Myxococcaceae bacterium]|nr:acyl-CoA dehydrogenase family protein [Myxococcaceae bacterium]